MECYLCQTCCEYTQHTFENEYLTLMQAAVAQPKTAEEVSAIVKFATSNGIAFNVKGGGHSSSQASSAPSPEGMVLDLSLMRNVSVDPEAQTVTFEGGCLWRDVDDALWKHGLATTGGTVSHTGVGGLILHGGFGMLSGRYGLTIDLLKSCQVVLADGQIITASKTENPDLFWALRGAGSSFGVVTQFTSQAFPQGDIWGGMMVLSRDKLPEVVDFVNYWGKTNDGDQSCGVVFARAPPTPGMDPSAPRPPVIIVQMAHVGPTALEDGPTYYEPVLKLDSFMKNVGPMPYPALNKSIDDAVPHGRRWLTGGSNFTLPLQLSSAEAIRDEFERFVEANPQFVDSICLLECFANKAIQAVPVKSTAFNSRGNYYNIGAVWCWDDAALDQTVRTFNRQYQKDVREMGYNDPGHADGVGYYINYVNGDTMSAEAAFGSHADRLRDLKKKYDPSNVFDKLWKLVGQTEERWAV